MSILYVFYDITYTSDQKLGGPEPSYAVIVQGSSYADEMIIDVVASKYCDLIPVERYVQMAPRSGLSGLPPHSLIELTHHFASFAYPIYERIRDEVLKSRVIHADETPHKMLEGSDKKSWYLWGISNKVQSHRWHFVKTYSDFDEACGNACSTFLK